MSPPVGRRTIALSTSSWGRLSAQALRWGGGAAADTLIDAIESAILELMANAPLREPEAARARAAAR